MPRRPKRLLLTTFGLVFGLLTLAISPARAASLPYVVTDLGIGDATLDAARGLVIAPGGTTGYTFLHHDHAVASPDAFASTLPSLGNAPVSSQMTYGNPANAYSDWSPSGIFLNDKGQLVATNIVGVYGHIAGAGSQIVAFDRAGDGSLGAARTVVSSPNNTYTGGQIARALDLNDAGQVLGLTQLYGTGPNARELFVYDLAAGSTKSITGQLAGWVLKSATAIDEDGRILLSAFPNQGGEPHSLLLSPESAVPAAVPVPEPSTLATLVLGAVIALRRRGRLPR